MWPQQLDGACRWSEKGGEGGGGSRDDADQHDLGSQSGVEGVLNDRVERIFSKDVLLTLKYFVLKLNWIVYRQISLPHHYNSIENTYFKSEASHPEPGWTSSSSSSSSVSVLIGVMCSDEDGLWWILIKSGVYVTFPHQCHHPPQPCLRIINSLSTANILTKYSKQRLNEKWVAACLQSLTYIVCSVNWIQTGTLYFNPHFSTFMSPPVRAAHTWECSNFACLCWAMLIENYLFSSTLHYS